MTSSYARRLAPWLSFGLISLLFEFGLRAGEVPAYLIPLPSAVALEILHTHQQLARHLGVTMTEALIGFAVGNCFAVSIGFLFSQLRLFRDGFYPVVVGLQAVPVVALAPYMYIWFGPGLAGKAAMAGIICYFPATVIATNGFSRVNSDALMLMRSLGASPSQIFWSLRLPAAVPSILSALEVSITLCTVGAVVAELAGASEGIGYLVVRASYEFKTTSLFAALVVISLSTFLLFRIVQTLGKYYAARYSFSYSTVND